MQFKIKNTLTILLRTMALVIIMSSSVKSGTRFSSGYSCSDTGRTCLSSGTRIVDGFAVHKDCWEWSYTKSCNYPSRNNCINYAHCYAVANLPCLLHDNYRNCVNLQKEFSCSRKVVDKVESRKTRVGLEEKEGIEGLVCKGIACIDGNCIDKSYQTNGEMMDSVSKLYAVSQMKDGSSPDMKIFAGYGAHCSKKATSYSNCCGVGKGWGHNFGAGCSKDEQNLMEARRKKLCVYVGNENKGVMKAVVKHHFCCWGNMLDKVIQVEGRKQLGMNFGSGGSPNCRGLTLDELQRINFDLIDFTEFIEDFKVKFFGNYKSPTAGDLELRVKGSMPDIRKYDGNPGNPANNMTGWSASIKDDSWEVEEERRLEEQRRLEEERRIAEERQIEEAKQAQAERLAADQERQRVLAEQRRRGEEEKEGRKKLKEQELRIARDKYNLLDNEYRNLARKYRPRIFATNSYGDWDIGVERTDRNYYTYKRQGDALRSARVEVRRLETDLGCGRY